MAVTLDAALGTGKAHVAQDVSVVTGAAVAAGSIIVMTAIIFQTVSTVFSVSATGGLTWSTAVPKATSGSLQGQMFAALAPAGLASTTTLTVHTTAGMSSDMMISAVALAGANSATPAAFNSASGTGTAWNGGALGTGGDGGVAAAFEDGNATATSTTTAPAVEYADFNDATQTEAYTAAYQTGIGNAGVTIAGTWSASVTWLALSAVWAASAAAAGPAPRGFDAIPFMPNPTFL